MTSSVSLGLALAVVLVSTFALYAWGMWVSRRQRHPVYRGAARGVLLGVVIALAGATFALRRLESVRGGAVGSGSAADATAYARGVSSSFGLAAIPIALGNLILVASLTVLLVGTLRTASDKR